MAKAKVSKAKRETSMKEVCLNPYLSERFDKVFEVLEDFSEFLDSELKISEEVDSLTSREAFNKGVVHGVMTALITFREVIDKDNVLQTSEFEESIKRKEKSKKDL